MSEGVRVNRENGVANVKKNHVDILYNECKRMKERQEHTMGNNEQRSAHTFDAIHLLHELFLFTPEVINARQ